MTEKPEPAWDRTAENDDEGPRECPICGFYFCGGECVGCGFREEPDR